MKDLAYYLGLNYPVTLVKEDTGYSVAILDLPGCLSQGETLDEAMENIEDAKAGWLEIAIEQHFKIREPGTNGEAYKAPAPTASDRERAFKLFKEIEFKNRDFIVNKLEETFAARDEELVAAAREAIEALRCPDCKGSGTLGQYKGKPVSCEKCYGHEDSAGLGFVLDGDNVVEKLWRLAALVKGVGK